MASMNRVMLVGHLGHSARVRKMDDGQVAELRLATTDGHGARQHTEWHRVLAFGALADLCEGHASKGRLLYVEGSVRYRKWTPTKGPNAGRPQVVTEVIASRVDFLDKKPGRERQPGEDG